MDLNSSELTRQQEMLVTFNECINLIQSNDCSKATKKLLSSLDSYKDPDIYIECDIVFTATLVQIDRVLFNSKNRHEFRKAWVANNLRSSIESKLKNSRLEGIFRFIELIGKDNSRHKFDSLEKIASKFPDSNELQYILALILVDQGSTSLIENEAENKLQRALDIFLKLEYIFMPEDSSVKFIRQIFIESFYTCIQVYVNFFLYFCRNKEAIYFLNKCKDDSLIQSCPNTSAQLRKLIINLEVDQRKYESFEKRVIEFERKSEKSTNTKFALVVGSSFLFMITSKMLTDPNLSFVERILIIICSTLSVGLLFCLVDKRVKSLKIISLVLMGMIFINTKIVKHLFYIIINKLFIILFNYLLVQEFQ